jgi:membrane-bound serine protease (ClpP class)
MRQRARDNGLERSKMNPSPRVSRSAGHLSRLVTIAGLAWWLATALAGPAVQVVAAADATDTGTPIYVATATGVVDNVMAGYIEESVKKAVADGTPLLVIQLNTPGGSLDATQRIVSALLESPVPTVVWVSPSGARAASAGTFITLAASLAYMAPGTNIGAASPVGSGGEELTGTIGTKVKNDAIASIKSIARERGHNVDWAVSTVDKAVSSPASEAVSIGAVNGTANSLEDLRSKIDGTDAKVKGGTVRLALAGVPFADLSMNPAQSIIHLLSDPNIAFILLTLGFYGLLFELQNPNFVTGILGAIALILAFIGFGSLPLNVAGVLLIGLAIVLFVLETTVTSHGLLAIGGLVCFALGAFTLYTAPTSPAAPDVRVALPILVTMVAVTAAYVGLVLLTVTRVRRRTLAFAGAYGAGGTMSVPLGTTGVARTALSPTGVVYAAGEEWSARSDDRKKKIARGTKVHVVGQENLTLVVESGPASQPDPG